MKILVIGLGSMGKRRIRNLQALGERDIYGFELDTKTARTVQKEYKITLLQTLDAIASYGFELVVISTPPGVHLPFVEICAKQKIPFFTELNLVTKEAEAILALTKKYKVLGLPSDTELFDADITKLSGLVGEKFRGYFVFHLGQHIADWHPWEKAGKHFIFHPQTNGMREMLRVELPWMTALCGPVLGVTARGRSFQTQKYGIDDMLCVDIAFVNGNTGVVILDLLAPKVIKRLDVVSADKIITWHERKNEFEISTRDARQTSRTLKKKVEKQYQFHEDAHLAEMRHVLSVVMKKEKSKLSFEKEITILRLIDTIERNSRGRVSKDGTRHDFAKSND